MWLAAMGLTAGILAIVLLLGLIVRRGLAVFWPERVILIEVRENAPGEPGARTVLAGERVLIQRNPETGREEWLMHLGNRSPQNSSGAWRYIDTGDILNVSQPVSILTAERLEYGDAFFDPVELRLRDGTVVAASDPAFRETLDRVIADARGRRERVLQLERKDIGRINRAIAKEDRRIRKAASDSALSSQERDGIIRSAEARKASLEEDYRSLAARAAGIRAEQAGDVLVMRLPDGELREQAAGELIRVYAPNALGFAGRLKVFFSRLTGFLTEDPREANTEGGIFPALFGTFVMTVLMSLMVTPLGVVAAIHLREYARQGPLVRAIRISVNNLAGVPSIVYGVFGLGFFVYTVGHTIDQWFFRDSLPAPTFGTGGLLWASLTLALLTLPVVIVATEEALTAVPRGVREAALACGASKWQMIQRVVLPAAAPGILTGVILAMARGAGEVAPLMLVGVVKLAPSLPLDLEPPFIHAERKFMHLGFHIYDVGFQSPDSEAAKPMVFAATLLLITLVVVMNLAAILLRNRLRRKYVTGAF